MKRLLLLFLPLLASGQMIIHPYIYVVYDADTQDWLDRVDANGGTVSSATAQAVDDFVLAAKANGYWSDLRRVNLFCGDDLASVVVPLVNDIGDAKDTSVGFVEGDYDEGTGLTGDGSSYLKTGVIPSVDLNNDDTHLSMYVADTVGSSQTAQMRAANGINRMNLLAPWITQKMYSDHYNTTSGRAADNVAIPLGVAVGHVVGSRISDSNHGLYTNSVSIANNPSTPNGNLPATYDIWVFAGHDNGSPSAYVSDMVLGAYSIGDGLTSAQIFNYYTDMEAFQDALGRGVM